MLIDYTITIGNIVEIVSILVGGIAFLVTMRATVSNLKSDVVVMQNEIKKVGEVLIKMAVTTTRLDNLEKDVRDLKHGRGFVREAITREYP